MKPGVAARASARRIVTRVLRSGAYSNLVVRSETRDLPDRSARLAQRLAYDTIRNLLRIDRTIASVSARESTDIDDEVLDSLRTGLGPSNLYYWRDKSGRKIVNDVIKALEPQILNFQILI